MSFVIGKRVAFKVAVLNMLSLETPPQSLNGRPMADSHIEIVKLNIAINDCGLECSCDLV